MIVKSILILSVLISLACTSSEEAAPAVAEPVAPEPAELTDTPTEGEAKPAEEAPPASEPAAETPETAEPVADAAPAAPETPSDAAGDFFIAVSHLNVRSGPGMANGAVDVLTFNTPVQSLGVENRIWVKIGEGRYVSKNYLSEQKLSEPMQVQSTTQQQPVEMPVESPVAEEQAAEEAPAEPEMGNEAPPVEEGSEN